jgi:hypothetical protein
VDSLKKNAQRRLRYHQEGVAEHVAQQKREWKKKNPQSVLITLAKYRAKRKNILFNLTPEDITIPEYCPVLGIKLQAGLGKIIDSSPTIDRINPNLGYIKGNIKIISHKANRIKNNASLEELRKVVDYVSNL